MRRHLRRHLRNMISRWSDGGIRNICIFLQPNTALHSLYISRHALNPRTSTTCDVIDIQENI